MKSVIPGTVITGIVSNTVANYYYINHVFSQVTPSTTEAPRQMVLPCAITLSQMTLTCQTAPGVGKNFVYTVYKNGAPTGLTVTIADTATSATDSTHSVSFAAGDTVSIESVPTGTPTAPGNVYWNIQADAGTSNLSAITGGTSANASTTLTNYMNIMGGSASAWAAAEADYQIIVPTSGTLKNLRIMHQIAPSTGKSYTYTVMKNGVATALVAAVTDTNTTGSDLSNSFTVIAGDTLTMRSVPSGTPTTPGGVVWGLEWDPSIPGESFYGFGSAVVPSATVTNFEQLIGPGRGSYNVTENTRQAIFGAYLLTAFYVKLGTAPGVGNSRTFTVRNNAANTSLAVTIADTATTGNVTAQSVTPASSNFQTLQSAITATPAALTGGLHTGLLMYIAPPATAASGSNLMMLGV